MKKKEKYLGKKSKREEEKEKEKPKMPKLLQIF
jgi:hypothetical protein